MPNPNPTASQVNAAIDLTILLGRLILATMDRPIPGVSAGELFALVMPKNVSLEAFEGAVGLLVRSTMVTRTKAGWLTIEVAS